MGSDIKQTAGERAIYTMWNYHDGDFWPFQHLEMAMPVTELTAQQFSYFERGSAHTLELRSIYPLKDNRRGAMEKKLVYIVYSCHTGDFGPWARFRHMAGQKNWKMRYLFKRLDQQTTTTAHPQWAMGTHRSAPCLHLDGLVTHLNTLIFFEFPLPIATGMPLCISHLFCFFCNSHKTNYSWLDFNKLFNPLLAVGLNFWAMLVSETAVKAGLLMKKAFALC